MDRNVIKINIRFVLIFKLDEAKTLGIIKNTEKDLKSRQLSITADLVEEYRLINNRKQFCWKVGCFYYNLLKKCCLQPQILQSR